MSELLPSVEKVHKISIIPRGKALGYTLNLPEEDRYLKSKDELIEHLVVLLAGRTAESAVFGPITTGASDDLKKVNEIGRAMVTEYGMGTSLGSRRLPAEDYSMSDATRLKVDEAQQEITDLAYRQAVAMIVENRSLLETLATTLLENEVLERDRHRAHSRGAGKDAVVRGGPGAGRHDRRQAPGGPARDLIRLGAVSVPATRTAAA